ncbi:MAG: GNAT family N-acetyltransferase, partial [Candidatus Omnitrophica bacterium]|nr:GNAT family N-acetyltransferase [Candidatus Omnitrophota bacterium]
FRRKGIGERLFRETVEWFRAKGVDRIELRVVVANEVSTAFWRKMGFAAYMEILRLGI